MSLEIMEFIKVTCPACGQQVEATVRDDRIQGYCAVAKQYVDSPVKVKPAKRDYRQDPKYRAKLRAATKKMWQNPDYRAKQKAALKNKDAGINPF
jgi:hypothetical protein